VDGAESLSSNALQLFNAYRVPALAWGALIGVYWMARPFLPMIACTFYFTVMGNSAVAMMQDTYAKLASFVDAKAPKLAPPRKAFAALYALLLIAGIGRFGLFLFPKIMKESQYVINVAKSEDPYKLLVSFVSNTIGLDTIARSEKIITSLADASGLQFAGYIEAVVQPREGLVRRFGKLLQYYVSGYLNSSLSLASRIISNSTSALCNAALGLLLSIMVVWDSPQLQKMVASLKYSRVGPIYEELSPKVSSFVDILAKSFEVQAIIALVNCLLTTAGLVALKIPGVEFFSLLTFVSSFIPVVGIFIATTPPIIVALTEFGLDKCLQLLAMVAGVHAVESYLLYPQIYSAKLKLHPTVVLASLIGAEHFAGIPGLFLAMPITLFTTNHLLFPKDFKRDSAKGKIIDSVLQHNT